MVIYIWQNKKVTTWNNITLGDVGVNQYGFEKRSRYMAIWTKAYAKRCDGR